MAAVGQLDSYFTSLISNLMVIERQPLTRLTRQKDTLSTQKAIYSDLRTRLDGLQSALDGLRSSQASYALKSGRKASVSPPAGATVLTASVGASALTGNYTVSVETLARAHSARSGQQSSADQQLGVTAQIRLGGGENRSAERQDVHTDTVADLKTTTAIDTGQKELGSGDYFVETRFDSESAKWQFRLVDSEGVAVNIRKGDQGTTFTSAWQAFDAGQKLDTGRGLEITFGSGPLKARDRLHEAAQVSYTAKGVILKIEPKMSLNDIAYAINQQSLADGNEITASVVDRRLALQTSRSGVLHKLSVADVEGTFLQDIGLLDSDNQTFLDQTLGRNSVFTVNNIRVERSSNTGLSDVISGVSLNLAGDAEGKTASLGITADTTNARGAISAFITKFNELQSYLKGKTAVTKNADGTYKREALAGDGSLKSLSSELYFRFTASAANSGAFTNLRQIGIDLDENLTATVTDFNKLDDALINRLPDVQKVMDAVMSNLNSRLSTYTGDKGYAATARKSTEDQIEMLDDRISALNDHLSKVEERYTQQYAEIQAQLLQMTYASQQWSSIYSKTSQMI